MGNLRANSTNASKHRWLSGKFFENLIKNLQELQCEACPDQTPGEDGEVQQQKELAIIPDEINSISGENNNDHGHDETIINAVETKTIINNDVSANQFVALPVWEQIEHLKNGTIANSPAKHDIMDETKNGQGLKMKVDRQNRSKACSIV